MEGRQEFKFNDIDERYRFMNKIYLIGSSIIWAMILFYVVLKYANNHIPNLVAFGSAVMLFASFVGNIIKYKKDETNKYLKNYVVVEFIILFIAIGLSTSCEFIRYCLLGVLALQIPYHDEKGFRKITIVYSAALVAVTIFQMFMNSADLDVDALSRVLCSYMMIYILYKVSMATRNFTDDALGFANAQTEKQKETMDGVLTLSKIVQDETEKGTALIDELVEVTKSVAENMIGITEATDTTSINIEEQNTMTQTIQNAIDETAAHSKQVVDIATESNDSIYENIELMNQLIKKSAHIADLNKEVTKAMKRLDEKTVEVENIAGMILDISNQTNLLALNASIESARAGEAGKGFSVVADQIRQLAERTKHSTEEITHITTELKKNSEKVVDSVLVSVDETENQHKQIVSASTSFEKLNENMVELIDGIKEIDNQISDLATSNEKIVDNITELTSATQEVNANSKEVQQISEENLAHAKEVKQAIQLVQETIDDMKKYL